MPAHEDKNTRNDTLVYWLSKYALATANKGNLSHATASNVEITGN